MNLDKILNADEAAKNCIPIWNEMTSNYIPLI